MRPPSLRIVFDGGVKADLLVIGCFQGETLDQTRLPEALLSLARSGCRRKAWRGESGQVLRLATESEEVSLLALLGLGPRDQFDGSGLAGWLDRAVGEAQSGLYRRITVCLPEHDSARGNAGALNVLTRLLLTGYRFERFLSGDRGQARVSLQVLPPAGQEGSYRKARSLAPEVAAGVALARDLGNTPPNEATPEWMAEQARSLAEGMGLKIEILGPREMEKRGMGAILAVGGGSSHPPRLVRLDWGEGERRVALVGKGVTFDTGGISIKPAAAMDEMKYDKCGACTVLGVSRATAGLELPFRFSAYLPLAENMPDGASYRPGDIVRCYGGRTVEILNTDAEGRMLLADALGWAAEEGPDTLIELSTLTGATVVALGHLAAALYAPDDELAQELLRASASCGERIWRMPLWPEHLQAMKGDHGDLKNIGGRWGGANQAAAFLSRFVGDVGRWAHLDIAGTAWIGSEQKGRKGATGFGVPLTLTWLLQQAGRL